MPGRVGGGFRDIVAVAGGERDGVEGLEAEAGGEVLVILADGGEAGLGEIDQVHLVHGEDDVADAEQRDDEGVAAGLGDDALAGVDQEDGEVGGGGAGRHVAGVLLVAGRVGDDEAAAVGGEEAVGDVDGDALLALGLEAVHEEGVVGVLAGGAELAAVALERGELVLEEGAGFVEEAADEGGFAVVHAAAGEEAKEARLGRQAECGDGVGGGFGRDVGHQK